MASNQIPLTYRVMFNWIEPIQASIGAFQAYFLAHALAEAETPNIKYHSGLQPLYTQKTGAWLLLASHSIVLHYTQDPNLWRLIQVGGLFSDVFYLLSLYEDRGPARFWSTSLWTPNDWAVIIASVLPFAIRIACVAGLGFKKQGKAKTT
ncbi:hypothetical protein BT63DRAFT_194064 [Microthyrium microscopicum]|uniref:DUF7704 domain-containing protein n=1 Tax=Microthyrium microscopicum TaxID=703497 RepID=A0A6A6ULJ7_9PEZI|nr:hypothetical protein BT63DRAFT_194064 [Microthyrium microscopicum]